MYIWLVLISLSVFAQSEQAIEEYCFSSPVKMKEIHSRLKFILVPVDQVQENSNCFTVKTSSHRRELIQSFVRRYEPAVQISFSSAEIKRDPCRIKVEKMRKLNTQGLGGGASVNNGNVSINASESQTNRSSSDVTNIQTLKEFELTVNQDVVKGECRVITPTRYEISLEVRKDAQPLLPPVPSGTIVVVPDAQIPPTQETSKLQTSLQLNSGERVEIGSVVKNLKDGAKKVDISNGAALENTDGAQSEKVFLSID